MRRERKCLGMWLLDYVNIGPGDGGEGFRMEIVNISRPRL